MKNKQIARIVFQTLLVMISISIILEFYQYDTVPYIIRWVTTIVLMVANCVFNHWCGLKNGIEMSDRHNKRMNELRNQSFDKIVNMAVKEKTENKSME